MFLAAAAALAVLSGCGSSGGSGGDSTGPASTSPAPSGATSGGSSGSSGSSSGGSASVSDASTPPAPTTSAPPDTRCHTSELSLTFGGTEGAAGTIYSTFVLTNTSGGTCDVYGYPGVSYYDAGGNPVRDPATRQDYQGAPELVSVPAGQAAHFVVANSDVIPQTGCASEADAASVRVYPPDETAPINLAAPAGTTWAVCNPRVSPVHPGATGP